MAEDQRFGTAYWIDHYVVPTADASRFIQFYTDVFAGKPRAGDENRPGTRFTWVGQCHVGGSPARDGKLTPGTGFPRYSWFVRKEEVPEHLARLDSLGVSHSEPIQTSAEGEAGIAIRFADPDGNPLELWAPDHMPEGAMVGESAAKVGRIAAATYESRDLARTSRFYQRYCGLDPLARGQVADDTLVFPLASGGRLIFKKADVLGNRTLGHAVYRALHTALVVRHDEFMPILERMYADLPEWEEFDPENLPTLSPEEAEALPARTGMHGNPIGAEWKRVIGRADSFFDWDGNCYHFVPASPMGGSMATFDFVPQEKYLEERRAPTAGR